jgi:membrane-associated protein
MLPGVDLQDLIKAVGYLGLFAIVFAESGLLIGFFLPGDSLLFTAGFLASLGFLDIRALLVLLAIAAITGDQVGYLFGRRVGPALFRREDSFWFNKKHLERAHAFYEKHGGKTIVLARFMPIVRTFAPIVAGAGQMDYGRFVFYNIAGGLLWTISMLCGGYLFGQLLPAEHVDKYLLPVIALIIVLSVAPSVIHLYRENRETVHRVIRERRLRTRTP